MKIHKLFFILFISNCALFLRFYIDNIFLISFLASFIFGILIPQKIINKSNKALFFAFFSSFTTFSGFIPIFYQIIVNGKLLNFFFLINFVVIANVMIMYLGFLIGKRFPH